MLADEWNSPTVTNLQNVWKKLWSVVEEENTSDSNRIDSDEGRILNEISDHFSAMKVFEKCDADDTKQWLNNGSNLTVLIF